MNAVNAAGPPGCEGAAAAPLRRRARLRAATEAEIVDTARALLVEGGVTALTLREVGRRMGMTASALYRYVDGHAALVDRLVGALLRELLTAISDAFTADPRPQDPVEALCTAARTFRQWGVAHPAEFGLAFGPRPPGARPEQDSEECRESRRFGLTFGELVLAAVAGERVWPSDADPDAVIATMPPALADLYVRGWVRLYGATAIEVFGYLQWCERDPDEVFEAELADVRVWLSGVLADLQPG